MQLLRRRGFLVGFASLVLFTGLAGDAFRNSFSWYGYGVICVGVVAMSVMILVTHRRDIRWGSLPLPLLAFLGLTLLSIAWSFYPGASALGVFAQVITTLVALAVVLPLTAAEVLRAFGYTLRVILSLSLIFELFVSIVVRAPVFPVWVPESSRIDPPALLYWSRNLLLEGDKIQGIVGSSTLLGMIALVALIVFGVQLAAGAVRREPGVLWVALALLMLALTRSATVNLALVAVIVVLGCILLVRRADVADDNTRAGRPHSRGPHADNTHARRPRARSVAYAAIATTLAAIATTAILLRGPILDILGKSETLTGRQGIWDKVIALAQERPVFGWGWVSFWPPWVAPYDNLIQRGGIIQLHAHEAWLDVWLQLGAVGLVVFGALVATTAVRAWLLATDSDRTVPGGHGRYSAMPLFAPLLLTAMLVQSLAESRMLIEGGWMMLVILAVSTKFGVLGSAPETAPAVGAAR